MGRSLQRLLVRNVLVDVGEIRWIGAERSYARIHLGTGSYPIRTSLGRLALRLDPDRFARIHRSTIVNLDHVRQVVRWFGSDYLVRLQDGAELRLSRTYWRGLKERLIVIE
ncbi:MAG TPA: LytTR family DNA-binding domain-containing protein [Longimicrobium sp.]|nr:LytTR family DNA-binding domain-containing protein [Longimicrobium sp.]